MAAHCSSEAQRQPEDEKKYFFGAVEFWWKYWNSESHLSRIASQPPLSAADRTLFCQIESKSNFFRLRSNLLIPVWFLHGTVVQILQKKMGCRPHFLTPGPRKTWPPFFGPQKKKRTPKGVKKDQRRSKSQADVHNSVHKHSKSIDGITRHTYRFRTNFFCNVSKQRSYERNKFSIPM